MASGKERRNTPSSTVTSQSATFTPEAGDLDPGHYSAPSHHRESVPSYNQSNWHKSVNFSASGTDLHMCDSVLDNNRDITSGHPSKWTAPQAAQPFPHLTPDRQWIDPGMASVPGQLGMHQGKIPDSTSTQSGYIRNSRLTKRTDGVSRINISDNLL